MTNPNRHARRCACCSLSENLPHVGPFVEREGEQVCKSCAFNIDERAAKKEEGK